MNRPRPLSIVIEETREKLSSETNRIINESKLPAFIVEGLIMEQLAEIRKRKNTELISDTVMMFNSPAEEECNIGKDSQTKECN